MIVTIGQFRYRIEHSPDQLISDLQAVTGRFGQDEADAWRASLLEVSRVFTNPSLEPFHLYFGSRGHLSLEYQLPASPSWCDLVLLGKHQGKATAVIFELKNWITAGDAPGRVEGLISRQGGQYLHPSEQVRGYTAYCQRFHSTVHENSAVVYGCVLFTRDWTTAAYTAAPNDRLTAQHPVFATRDRRCAQNLPEYFADKLTEPDELFAKSFERGIYRQNRSFVAQIAQQILAPRTRPFELLDHQQRAFLLCRAIIEEIFLKSTVTPRKRVILVKGPPGSGKSAVAARLWASLITDDRLPQGNVIFVTTSQSQNSNWSYLFDQEAREPAAHGVLRRANMFMPVSTHRVGQMRRDRGRDFIIDATAWRQNLQLLRNLGEPFKDGANDNQNLVSIVDEAHALINPEHTEGRGQFGFAPTLGPQAYHIMRSSVLSVFFLDVMQGYRSRENTRIEDFKTWARELGADQPEEVSLENMQFRCAGSPEVVEWIEGLLEGKSTAELRSLAEKWRNRRSNASHFDFRVCSDPAHMEQELRAHALAGATVRLLSTYSRKWKTKGTASPYDLPADKQDFFEQYVINGEKREWARVWNHIPSDNDYAWFVQARPGRRIAEDPLAEVGCTYAVRGFDFDYIGVLWLDDLVWRNGRWHVNPLRVFETGVDRLLGPARGEARKGEQGSASQELLITVLQAYRIVLTRALSGAYVWVPDDETRRHIAECLDDRDR